MSQEGTLSHQDWTTIYTRSKKPPKGAQAKDAQGAKTSSVPPLSSHKERKLDERIEAGDLKARTFDAAFGKRVQAHRIENSLTQKQLAQQMRVTERIIKDIEAGKGNYNPTLMSRLQRAIKHKR